MSARAPYAPLRPQTLAVQGVLLIAAEAAIFWAYDRYDSRFHYATHLFVGVTAAALVQLVWLSLTARPHRGQLLTYLAFHLWAMWPDLAFRGGLPHRWWMDWLALGHVSSHLVPGDRLTWLLVAGAAVLGYGAVLTRWLRARATEAEAGLAPAFAVTGSGLVAAQADPRTTPLGAVRLGDAPGPAELVLVHGLGAASSSWQPVGELLAADGLRVLMPDLLGFGSSRRTGTLFTLDAQARALARLLDAETEGPVVIAAHSWGAVVVAEMLRQEPRRVDRLVLVAPAVFSDVAAAKARIARQTLLARLTLRGSGVGEVVCGFMCLTRPLLGRLAHRVEPDLPPDIAGDVVEHSYAAYADGLASLWERNPAAELLQRPPCPVLVVLGEQDEMVRPEDLLELPLHPEVQVVRVEGTHYLPFEQPARVAELIMNTTAVHG